MTLYGAAKWKNEHEEDLFSKIVIPENIASNILDRDTLIENILLRGGEFEVIYADPDFMENAIGTWWKKWLRTIEKWCEALIIEYEPLENYDRKEEWTTTDDGHFSNTANTNLEEKVSAFNSPNYSPNTKTDTNNVVTGGNDNTNVRSGRAHGNIGVTTSQQMLRDQLDLQRFNLYEQITDLFLTENVLMIYI